MTGKDGEKQVPPPMDPYAVYQTPYEREKEETPNPFIEFRRFADRQVSSFFDGLTRDMATTFRKDLEAMRALVEDRQSTAEERLAAQERQMSADLNALAEHFQESIRQVRQDRGSSTNSVRRTSETLPPDLALSNSDAIAVKAEENHSSVIESTVNVLGTNKLLERQSSTDKPSHSSTTDLIFGFRDNDNELQRIRLRLPGQWNKTDNGNNETYFTDGALDKSDLKQLLHDCESLENLSITSKEDLQSKAEKAPTCTAPLHSSCHSQAQADAQTELDVYEQLEQQQMDDYRARRWQNGFKNCPELIKMQKEAVQDHSDSFATSLQGLWSWLPTYGFDGMTKARNITLFVPTDSSDDPEYRAASVEKEYHDQFSPEAVVDAVTLRDSDHSLQAFQAHSQRDTQSNPISGPEPSPLLQRQKSEAPTISPQAKQDVVKPSIISQLTGTQSRTLPDGSVETRRVLKKRFSDGSEESEESTDITPASKESDTQHGRSGWFWN